MVVWVISEALFDMPVYAYPCVCTPCVTLYVFQDSSCQIVVHDGYITLRITMNIPLVSLEWMVRTVQKVRRWQSFNLGLGLLDNKVLGLCASYSVRTIICNARIVCTWHSELQLYACVWDSHTLAVSQCFMFLASWIDFIWNLSVVSLRCALIELLAGSIESLVWSSFESYESFSSPPVDM